jgi:hypothetical protein
MFSPFRQLRFFPVVELHHLIKRLVMNATQLKGRVQRCNQFENVSKICVLCIPKKLLNVHISVVVP